MSDVVLSFGQLEATRMLINGTEVSLAELATRADKAQIQKHYKISSLELGISSWADAIVCRIAARDALFSPTNGFLLCAVQFPLLLTQPPLSYKQNHVQCEMEFSGVAFHQWVSG
eukprot:Gb_03775 [translate_table: standard]